VPLISAATTGPPSLSTTVNTGVPAAAVPRQVRMERPSLRACARSRVRSSTCHLHEPRDRPGGAVARDDQGKRSTGRPERSGGEERLPSARPSIRVTPMRVRVETTQHRRPLSSARGSDAGRHGRVSIR
jgi:hypothetical protein